MSDVEANKDAVRTWFAKGWNAGDISVADSLFSPDFTFNHCGREVALDWLKSVVREWRAVYPDLHMEIDEMIGEGDKIALKWHLTADLRKGTGLGIATFKDGKCVDYYSLQTD